MNSIIIFFALVLSYGLTYLVRLFALHKNIIDTPNERSSHSVPTPRGGGLAIVIAFYTALFVLYFSGQLQSSVFMGLLGLSSIAVIGFIDDHKHIPASYRLVVHFAAATWSCYWLGVIPLGLGDIAVFTFLAWGGSLFYLVWLLNLYNFMDGIDGIATTEAITVLVSASVLIIFNEHIDGILLIMLVLVAALLGFLLWNWPPAKIFMGDVGSAFLGILLASLSLVTANNGSLFFSIWLILLAVFITDATYTLLVRLFRGEKVYQAHRSHAYQYLSRQYGHKRVTMGVLLINVFWLLPLAGLANFYSQWLMVYIVLAYTPLIIVAMKNHAGLSK